MKFVQYLAVTIFILLNFHCLQTYSEKKKLSKPDKVPSAVWKASNFISEFHQRKFVEDVFHKISQPYLTSVTDEDLPDINVVNTLASVISNELIDKNRLSFKNGSHPNLTQTSESSLEEGPRKYVTNCEKYDYIGSPTVEIVNLTRFEEILTTKPNITNRTVPAVCVLALFYAHTCPFSAMAAPHFNALARTFPTIKMIAINTKRHQIINSQYGIVGVPTLMLFHNGRPVLKFNRRLYTLAQFSKFIIQYTGITANPKMFVASIDFGGPLPGIPKQETDYNLPLSWAVIIMWLIKFVFDSRWFQSINIPFYRRNAGDQ